jgi:hypothetical protein
MTERGRILVLFSPLLLRISDYSYSFRSETFGPVASSQRTGGISQQAFLCSENYFDTGQMLPIREYFFLWAKINGLPYSAQSLPANDS